MPKKVQTQGPHISKLEAARIANEAAQAALNPTLIRLLPQS